MIPRRELEKLYKGGLSMQDIADKTEWSYKQVVYWMQKHNIPRRTRNEANYLKYNPEGDPFKIKENLTKKEIELRGLGLGIYWGEGDKRNKFATRISNTDPRLIKKFKQFLMEICGVKEEKFIYSLVIFNDGNEQKAINFWEKYLGIKKEELGKIVKIPPQGKGTYKKKNQFGVLTVGVYNTKLKEKILEMINEF